MQATRTADTGGGLPAGFVCRELAEILCGLGRGSANWGCGLP